MLIMIIMIIAVVIATIIVIIIVIVVMKGKSNKKKDQSEKYRTDEIELNENEAASPPIIATPVERNNSQEEVK